MLRYAFRARCASLKIKREGWEAPKARLMRATRSAEPSPEVRLMRTTLSDTVRVARMLRRLVFRAQCAARLSMLRAQCTDLRFAPDARH